MLQHSYHYCLLAMLERYCGLLGRLGNTGDVMVESRGGNEDREFEAAYLDLYENGAHRGYLTAALAQGTLTSKRPKMRKKVDNIAGLQLADVLAHTAMRDVLISEKRRLAWSTPFADDLAKTLVPKYNHHLWSKRIAGYGRVLLT